MLFTDVERFSLPASSMLSRRKQLFCERAKFSTALTWLKSWHEHIKALGDCASSTLA